MTVTDKKADLAGPGIGTYEDVEKVLPTDYKPLLGPKETQLALKEVKQYIEDGLCKELNLFRVECPLIVDRESGMNDYLDRDGSRTPIEFHITNDYNKNPIDAQVVQAATKWKRWALKQFDCKVGEGIFTDMRAVRKDYFLDHDHSAYVDQWDWERVINAEDRNLDFLKDVVKKIWKVLKGAETACPGSISRSSRSDNIPTCRRNSCSCTPRKFWTCIPTFPASSARPRFSRSIPRSSSSVSAGRSKTAIRTKCAPPTTMTG